MLARGSALPQSDDDDNSWDESEMTEAAPAPPPEKEVAAPRSNSAARTSSTDQINVEVSNRLVFKSSGDTMQEQSEDEEEDSMMDSYTEAVGARAKSPEPAEEFQRPPAIVDSPLTSRAERNAKSASQPLDIFNVNRRASPAAARSTNTQQQPPVTTIQQKTSGAGLRYEVGDSAFNNLDEGQFVQPAGNAKDTSNSNTQLAAPEANPRKTVSFESMSAPNAPGLPGHPNNSIVTLDEATLFQPTFLLPRPPEHPVYSDHAYNIVPNQTYWEFSRDRTVLYMDTPNDQPEAKGAAIARRIEGGWSRLLVEVCVFPRIAISVLIILIMELMKLLVKGLVQPLCVGLTHLIGGYVVKPVIVVGYNECCQPLLVCYYHIFKLALLPCSAIADIFGVFLHHCGICCRSVKIVQVGKMEQV